MNPVTFTGTGPTNSGVKLTLGRLHIGKDGVPDGMNKLHGAAMAKFVTAMLWTGEGDDVTTLGHLTIDEDHLIQGLRLLFPNGELNEKPT